MVFDLVNAFALIKDSVQAALLIQDLLTEAEVKNLAKRLRIAKLVIGGKTVEDITKELHCSAATVSKVRLWIDNAGTGLRNVINKLPKQREVFKPRKIPGVGYGLDQIILHYSSLYLQKSEKQRLEKFLAALRAKSSTDRNLKEAVSMDFRTSGKK